MFASGEPRMVAVVLVGNDNLVRLREGRINVLGNLERSDPTRWPRAVPRAARGCWWRVADRVRAVAVWAERDPDGIHEHLRVVRPRGTRSTSAR